MPSFTPEDCREQTRRLLSCSRRFCGPPTARRPPTWRCAQALATDAEGELLVAHCEEFIPPGPRSVRYPLHADEDELKAKIKRQVDDLAEAGAKATLRTVPTSASGAAHAIADVARIPRADVIVVGTRGHTALGGLLVGSVTQRLLQITPCPVLAVRAAEGAANG